MVGLVFQILASLLLSACTLIYFGFVKYALVSTLVFVVVLSVFVNNERKIDAPPSGYELPPHQAKKLDLITRLGLASLCGACWPSLIIGAAFGWRRAVGGE